MPILDLKTLIPKTSCTYPAPFDAPCRGRSSLRLSQEGGLTQFGANLVTLKPGAWSSQRHHHSAEDELVYIISGTPTFIDDNGERVLGPGDVTAHPMGDGNGHHMINRTPDNVTFLVIGTSNPEHDHARYPDVDLDLPANGTKNRVFTSKESSQ